MTKGFLRSVVCAAVCKKKKKNPPRVSFMSEISLATQELQLATLPDSKEGVCYLHALRPAFWRRLSHLEQWVQIWFIWMDSKQMITEVSLIRKKMVMWSLEMLEDTLVLGMWGAWGLGWGGWLTAYKDPGTSGDAPCSSPVLAFLFFL